VSLARRLAAAAALLAAAGCAQRASLARFDLFVAAAGAITNARTAADRLPTRILLLLDNAAMRQFRLSGLGGFMAPRLDGYLAVVRLEGGRVSPAARQVLFHEYTHCSTTEPPLRTRVGTTRASPSS
jgi:hypothetical protein